MEGRGDSRESRRLRTPPGSGGNTSRRSRSSSIRRREQHLVRERERLQQLERTLQEERELEARCRRRGHEEHRVDSEQRSRRLSSEQRSRRLGSEQCSRRLDSGQRSRRLDSEQRSRRPGSEQRSRRLGSEQRSRRVDSEHCEHRGTECRGDRRNRDISPACSSRSCNPLYSSRDIIRIIHSLKNNAASQPSEQNTHSINKLDYKNILPEFDPSNKSQRMDVWLRKVNECASVYGWDDKTIIHFSMQKLQGLAKTWYQSLNTILFTWTEWQEKLIKAFPCEQNYGQSLEDMLRRKIKYNEPIENYFYEKLALINQCEITGKRAVDCIIHGLIDRTIKSSALALRCTEPDQLLQFLLSNKESPHQSNFRNKSAMENSHNYESSQKENTKVYNTGLFCYNCKEKGHVYLKCTRPLITCDYCHKIGHKIDNCRAKHE